MGKACDAMQKATSDTWHAFFPTTLDLPECVRKLLEFVYPTVDWDRVTWHLGFPHLVKWLSPGSRWAMTIPSTYSPTHIDIYLNPDHYSVCDCHHLGLLFVHEGFHVLQISDLIGGWGLGLARPITALYLTCYAGNGFAYDGVALEIPAYHVAGCDADPDCQDKWGVTTSLFEGCCADLPCDCSTDPPSLDAAALSALQASCANIVQTSSGLNFWEQMADCIPGLSAIKKAADDVYRSTCSFNKEPEEEPRPQPGPDNPNEPDHSKPPISFPPQLLLCLFGLIIAGFLYLVYGLYYIFWILLSFAFAFILWFVRILAEIIGLFVTGILGLVTGLVCLGEWLWEQAKALWKAITNAIKNLRKKLCEGAESAQAACKKWEIKVIETCNKWADEGHQECAKWADEGYEDCANWADEGYTQCDKKIKKCKWTSPWNCVAKWICKASHWVVKMVCKGWYWVTKMVCKGWYWVANMVCKGFAKTTTAVCVGSAKTVKAISC